MFLFSKNTLELLRAEISGGGRVARAVRAASLFRETLKTPTGGESQLLQSQSRSCREFSASCLCPARLPFPNVFSMGSGGMRLPQRQGELPRCRAGSTAVLLLWDGFTVVLRCELCVLKRGRRWDAPAPQAVTAWVWM